MPSHNQLMSTIIDDDELIDELRRYGEKNLPTTGGNNNVAMNPTSSRRKTAAQNQLTDQNREIYMKKLNHYKAREKIETNPSKQFIKQQNFRKSLEQKRISNIYRQYDENDEVRDDDNEDIIEIDSKNATSEFVLIDNVHTSPLSTSGDQYNDDYHSSSILTSTINHIQPTRTSTQSQQQHQQQYSGYVRLKDRIEIDKTLSKYRSEIHSILNDSIARNRNSESVASKLYQTDVKKEPETSKTTYCPKPEAKSPSFIGSLKSKLFSPKPVDIASIDNYSFETLKQIRGGHTLKYEQIPPDLKLHYSKQPMNTATNIRKSNDESVFMSFFSNFGLQISKWLPYLVAFIFALILLMYVRMKFISEPNEINQQVFIEEKLNDFNFQNKDNLFCPDVRDTQCSGTKDLSSKLIDFLRAKAGTIECLNIETERPDNLVAKCVHLNKITEYFKTLNIIKNNQYQTDAVNSVLKAVAKNPHWKIHLLDDQYKETNDLNDVTYLMSSITTKSLMCRFRELIHFIWIRLVMFTSIIVTLVSGYFVYSKIRLMNIEKDREYYDLITRVTATVEKHYELSLLNPGTIKPYIAISHIYDHLFDPSQRAAKKKLWNKVVDFIQNHESRIHLETQFINGEETNVWKWIVPKHDPSLKFIQNDGIGLANSTMMPPPIDRLYPNLPDGQNFTQDNQSMDQNSMPVNGWQGDAFNRAERLRESPTPCLKIRNMFDSSQIENDPLMTIRIHNDILDKCAPKNMISPPMILHIACDKKSKEGCVYIKCNSNDSAGAVYQILNASWYNGKLLNVKFLRSDRYTERFPDSITYNQQLRPINF